MHLYCQSFGFRQPYQILVDAETCRIAISHKIDIVKQLSTVLQGEVKPMITQCCIHELYLQGNSQQSATDLAKTFERRKCNHKEAIPGDDCLLNVVGDKNKHRYVITTQSQSLRVQLRTVPATPIVHVNRSVVILEPPSDVTLQAKARAEEQVLHATVLDKGHTPTSTTDHPPMKNKKGPKGPNPLSVKKKKPPTPVQPKAKPTDITTIKAGVKRQQEDTDREDAEAGGSDILGNQRKRKRRRKHAKSAAQSELATVESGAQS